MRRFVFSSGVDVEVLRSQVAWIVDELREFHSRDLAGAAIADALAGNRQHEAVDVGARSYGELRALVAVLSSYRVQQQPQPQEWWRLDRLRTLIRAELDERP